MLDFLGHGAGKVDLVDDGEDVQVVLQGEIDVRERLSLDALCGVHDEDRSVARGEGTADLIVKIHMSGRVDQVENVLDAVPGLIDEAHCLALDRNAALALKVHVVQDLVLHLAAREEPGLLDHAVRERGLAVIDVGNDAEVPRPLAYAVVVIVCHLISQSFP